MQGENRIITLLKKIWPTIYRGINAVFYFLISLIKGMVIYAIRQIKDI